MHTAQAYGALASQSYIIDYFIRDDLLCPGEQDDALLRYFDKPLPADDNKTVVRRVERRRPYDGTCSSDVRYTHVRLPRVSFIDGPYREAA